MTVRRLERKSFACPAQKLLDRLIRLECRMDGRVCPPYFIVIEQIPENDLDPLPRRRANRA